MKERIICFLVVFAVAFSFGITKDKKQNWVAIKGATIVPVVGENIPEGTILIKGHLIEAVGKNVNIPAEAEVIDAKGLIAYPGLIDGFCFLGLMEISALRSTIDYRENEKMNPQLKAVEALRPDSVHIPIARANGITAALVGPAGSLVAGQSGLIRLTGWTPEEMIIKSSVAMHIELPVIPVRRRRSETKPKEEASKQIKDLKKIMNEARFYNKRKEAARKNLFLSYPEFDENLEFLLPVAKGEMPVMISVHGERDILEAVKFVEEEKLKAIFFGVEEGWKVAEEIKKAGIPVVFNSMTAMPSKWEDGYDSLYRNPAVLHKAGVKFAFSSRNAPLAKDLPYNAAKAAAFGLDKKEALKGVTIYPAEIFGVSDMMGSLEKGKVANIVISDGDILELKTNIKRVFIDGKEMDLSNKYTELLEKFKKRDSSF